ncbi:kinase-like domain-containing protein [Rhizophagus irregularis DAOM 181602=DAOM 197198]|uniref:Kinase-like domain-containing protein n=1 Tax=Rhizophagus irregularis (strain DAOM 181602 / DAOM 197198 / MUCL 43194) TaxID=747089 RepID=A0A2P4PBQ8_RHIID|nr:kinase-like domain-containing protein [Rhizophagus irregularis DAOM 181602=DAOM 197198]POG62834.1 kinase-like domain-containing protein [Rhizophagus irregularis DAOM 181602=DAOM 197198]|eukprot:XP_025169700.1 kinase-like domain-containing protein [Rhizophagus irregularis DAOM 181602=DAOM 197198]
MRFMWDQIGIKGNRKRIEIFLRGTFQTSSNWEVFPQALNVLDNSCMKMRSFLCEFVSRLTPAAHIEIKDLYWYQKAAEQGFDNAKFNLGLWYNNEIFIEKDEAGRFYWCQKAAEDGDKTAQFNLGIYYYYGVGIEKDEAKSFYWFQKAAESGFKGAQFNLGICYQYGDCIEKDKIKAFYWYHKAVKNGLKQAQYNLGIYYENGVGIDKNEDKAFYWYQKAAENGVKEAQFNLGLCYENGNGIGKDEVKAFYWYHRAAENGLKEAQYNLGTCYKNGDGIEKDDVKAFYWYQKAVENGLKEAQLNLENCRFNGIGIEKDEVNIFYAHHKPEERSLNAIKWIENALKYEKVKFIPYKEIKNTQPLCKGRFGHISKVIWTKINNYVIYQKTSEYLLIMEYANGGDLQSYLKNNFNYLTWNDKKKLAFQIADGLNYLHNENVIHRDLHSRNIVIHENTAKITDFGISKNQNDQISIAYIDNFGVVAYMEPKCLIDPNFPYTKSSDIYSFGVLMWEISSGYPPFKDNDNIFQMTLLKDNIKEWQVSDETSEHLQSSLIIELNHLDKLMKSG